MSAIGLWSGQLPPPPCGGGGGWNAIRFKILDPLKYQISDPQQKLNIRYQGTPVSLPPPHSVTPCEEELQPRYVASRYRYMCSGKNHYSM